MVNKKTLIGLAILGVVGLIAIAREQSPSVSSDAVILPPCPQVDVLTDTPNDDLDPRWSPDGKQIAYVGHHEGNPELYLLDVATHDMTNISHSKYDDYNSIWSPDGRYIAFLQRSTPYSHDDIQLQIVEVATGHLSSVPSDYHLISPGYVVWTPDSKILRFLVSQGLFSYDPVTKNLHNDGGIGHPSGPPIGIHSQDGQGALAMNFDTPDGLPMKLVLTDAFGQNHTILQLNLSFVLDSWSPTRDQIAFYSYAGVYVIDIPTKNYRDFIQGVGAILTVDWSPDGNYIASLIAASTGQKVAIADIRSGAVCGYGSENFLVYESIFSDPLWSPTGDQVVFSSGGRGATNLVLLKLSE